MPPRGRDASCRPGRNRRLAAVAHAPRQQPLGDRPGRRPARSTGRTAAPSRRRRASVRGTVSCPADCARPCRGGPATPRAACRCRSAVIDAQPRLPRRTAASAFRAARRTCGRRRSSAPALSAVSVRPAVHSTAMSGVPRPMAPAPRQAAVRRRGAPRRVRRWRAPVRRTSRRRRGSPPRRHRRPGRRAAPQATATNVPRAAIVGLALANAGDAELATVALERRVLVRVRQPVRNDRRDDQPQPLRGASEAPSRAELQLPRVAGRRRTAERRRWRRSRCR